ncbi:membrane-targeted effector domain-containing toxin [Pseudomonas sp. MIACH]|uniref:membrane-targeted effector domain-containing toxin n=1 Tax=Pseudomonas sp. MIACH TaxID=1078355 RepID=UPI000B2B1E01|nr:membrane-targeted effector domain-containing toxin [Pseudomonas sp. MIACH]
MTTPSVAVQQPRPFLPSLPIDNHRQPLAGQSSTGTQHADSANTGLEQAQANMQNLRALGQKLNEIALDLGKTTLPQAILRALRTTLIDVHPASSSSEAGNTVTLEAYIRSSNFSVPTSHFALTALADAVLNRTQQHPLGNFGGALSWPMPLSAQGQNALLETALRYATQHPNPRPMGTSLGVLEYLNSNQPLSAEAMKDPAKALEALLGTPRAQDLGQALQTQLRGIATDTSVNDYTLAAMNVLLDPASIGEPHANTVANFDLAQQSHWGKPASAVLGNLSAHLETEGYATPAMANVGAYLLLARKAPELLIKDIPANVTYGSAAWVNLSIAAATIEAWTPGRVPNMTFAQVMMEAENAGLQNLSVTQQAQTAALRVWGVVNGVLSETEAGRYATPDIEKARSAFNRQADARVGASDQIEAAVPNRKEIALAKLKERFGEDVPFEEKLLTVKNTSQPYDQPLYDPNRAPAGRHSLLDIAMSGLHQYEWESTDERIVNATQGKSLAFDVKKVFDTQLTQAMEARKQGISIAIRQMISQLPIEDRENLEYGRLEFYQNHTYTLDPGFTGRTLAKKNDRLLIKSTGVSGETVYEVDLKQATIKAVPGTVLTQEQTRDASRIYPIETFTPKDIAETAFEKSKEARTPLPVPDSFSSPRTLAIADAFTQHLDIYNSDVIKQAKGATTFDRQMETQSKLANFFLDLIPLKSSIQNFSEGNYLDGAVDLGMDIFGFVTAGAGAAAKVATVASRTVKATTKALKVARILGTTVIGELNPLSGVGDLVQGGAKLIGKGVDKIKGATGTYDLTRTITREHGPITHGTFKVADQTYQGDTVLFNGQRYAYDPDKMKPYGPPLSDFNPLDTLSPHSPLTHSPRQRHAQRFNPMDASGRPIRVRKPLPDGDYVEATRGRLEPDHFKPDTKMATMNRFNEQMNEYYDAMKQGGLPSRPAIPDVPEPILVSELITKALEHSPGVVFGESHNQMASFRVLFDNVETLKNQGVKKVYFEGLIDMPQGLVDDGVGRLGRSDSPRTQPTFVQLREKLEADGIEVLPIDHYYLTRHIDIRRHLHEPTQTGHGSVRRLEEFNYYAAETIQATSGTEKWAALVGHSHMNTSEGVPGLAELTGSIGIGVFDNSKVPWSAGMKVQGRAPDPTKAISPRDIPGDLHIYIKP